MKKNLFIFSLIICVASAAAASFISLNTTVTSRVENNKLWTMISVINKGDEPAYNVQAEIRIGEAKYIAEKKTQLGVNQTYQVESAYKLKAANPGDYPLIVIMHYADANQYPFSAINCQTFSYKKTAPPSEIFGSLKKTTFFKTGKLKLVLKNMSEEDIRAMTSLVLPRELSVDQPEQEIYIPAKSSASLEFKVENFSALTGSNYQVFAVTQYIKDGFNQTNITPGMVHIVQEKKILGVSYTIIIIVLAVLAALFIAAQFFKPKR